MPDGSRIRSILDDQDTQYVSFAEMLRIEPDLFKGADVLDIGAADGLFSMAAKAAGANSVTAVDCDYIDWPLNIRDLSDAWNLDLKIETGDFRSTPFAQPFDVVLLMGVLYHLEDPFHAFRVLSKLVRPGGYLVIETQMSKVENDLPILELASDIYDTIADQAIDYINMVGVSNYIFPNRPAMFQLAHMFHFDCRQEGDSQYSARLPSRELFVMKRLPDGERWVPDQIAAPRSV